MHTDVDRPTDLENKIVGSDLLCTEKGPSNGGVNEYELKQRATFINWHVIEFRGAKTQ